MEEDLPTIRVPCWGGFMLLKPTLKIQSDFRLILRWVVVNFIISKCQL